MAASIINHNRQKTHCPRGHEYTEANTDIYTVNGKFRGRRCKKCRRDLQRGAVDPVKNRQKAKRRRELFPEEYVDYMREKRYGVTREQFEQMLIDQKRVCAICGLPNRNGKRLSVDHDHQTSKVRSLLCNSCNLLLGYAEENETTLENAVRYLRKWKSTATVQ